MKKTFIIITTFLQCNAYAENADNNVTELEPVVVKWKASNGYTVSETESSTGLPMTLKSLPQSISVITSEQLNDQNIKTMDAALMQATGVSQQIYGSNRAGYNYLFARGNKIENFQLDGLATNDVMADLGNISNTAYNRVEIVRGVSGLLDGTGEPSATVNLIRKLPTTDNTASINLSAGSRKAAGVEVDISRNLTEDGKTRARLVVAGERSDTWRQRETSRSSSIYGVVETEIGPNTLVTTGLSYDFGREDASASHSSVTYDSEGYATSLGKNHNPSPDWGFAQANTFNAFTTVEHDFNDNWLGRFTYNFTQHRLDHPHAVAGVLGIDHATGSADMISGVWRGNPKTHSVSATLNGKYELMGREHDISLGMTGFNYKNDRHGRRSLGKINNIYDDQEIATFPEPIGYQFDINTNSKKRQVGGYLATKINPIDKLSFLIGGRYSKVDYASFDRSKKEMVSVKDSDFTPYAGLTYDINDTFTTYLSYSQLFIPQSQKDENGAFVEAATGNNFEIGLKTSFFDDKLNASVSAFNTRKNNLAVRAGQDKNGDVYYKNANHSAVKGWEFDISGNITPNWKIQAGIARAVNKDQDDTRINPESSPETTAKVFTSYDFKLGAKKGWKLGGGVRWQSETHVEKVFGKFSDEALSRAKENAKQEPYAVVDLMAMYQFNDNASLSLNIDNVFDKEFRTQPDRHSYGEERAFMGTFRYDF